MLASVNTLSKLQEYPLGHAFSCYLSPAYDFEDTQSVIEALYGPKARAKDFLIAIFFFFRAIYSDNGNLSSEFGEF